nr:hypothetical protein [Olsenella uli]
MRPRNILRSSNSSIALKGIVAPRLHPLRHERAERLHRPLARVLDEGPLLRVEEQDAAAEGEDVLEVVRGREDGRPLEGEHGVDARLAAPVVEAAERLVEHEDVPPRGEADADLEQAALTRAEPRDARPREALHDVRDHARAGAEPRHSGLADKVDDVADQHLAGDLRAVRDGAAAPGQVARDRPGEGRHLTRERAVNRRLAASVVPDDTRDPALVNAQVALADQRAFWVVAHGEVDDHLSPPSSNR